MRPTLRECPARPAPARKGLAPSTPPHLLHSLVVPLAGIAIAAYLLGSIPTGFLLYGLFRRQDIRSIGSGNIGATNVLRAGGKGLGAATFVLDLLKGSAAVWLGGLLGSLFLPAVPLRTAQALAALCAVLGHMFTCWLRFRGGKGVATGFGAFLVIAPWAALAAIGVFALVLALSRYVSVASIVGAASFPIFAWFLVTGSRPPFLFVAGAAVSLLIVIKHRSNIRRLFAGTETRIGACKPA
ncbi:MAG: glycerol-3-phosphate 1-O-acyltransferase PlsY [Terracidiphilus sp.]